MRLMRASLEDFAWVTGREATVEDRDVESELTSSERSGFSWRLPSALKTSAG
jgi:hypothetical protein